MILASRICRLTAVLGLFAAGALLAADFPGLRHFPYEPAGASVGSGGDVLRGAKVSASSFEEEQRPEFAHDGIRDDSVLHWGTKQLPAWVRFDLPESRHIAQINVWFRVSGVRVHTFVIESSADGTTWQTVVDRRANTEPTPLDGWTFVLPQPIDARALRLTVLSNSKADEGAMIYEVAAFARPTSHNLDGAVGDIHVRYNAENFPVRPDARRGWEAEAWRGERVNGQFVVRTEMARTGLRATLSELRDRASQPLKVDHASVRFVRQVLADGELVGDVLDDATRVDLASGGYRALWLTVAISADAKPGVYSGKLTLRADGADPFTFPLTLRVMPATLPSPAKWSYHLDLWQHPWAIARWHDVTPWSDEHFRLMRPYLVELAQAGQKVITTTITHRPWGRRDYDDYGSMVEHVRQRDGSWKFNYEVFDRYVEFAMACGITQQINCYSLLTWSGMLYYTDAVSGDQRALPCEAGAQPFTDYWAPFLRDFERHLEAKGWLDRTRLAVDEAPAPMMKAMTELVRATAPKLRIALAGNQAPSHYTGLDLADFSIILDHVSDDLLRDIGTRRAEHRATTFYICLDPKRPNTFLASPPAESVWVSYYAAANGFDGLLRWALTTWPENPLRDTSYWGHPHVRYLPAGDTFLIYPGPRGSIRWELLRDGIEEYEKLNVLRARHGGTLPPEVAKLLEGFRDPKQLGDANAVRLQVEAMRKAITKAAKEG